MEIINSKYENKIKTIELENTNLLNQIALLENKIKFVNREKEDLSIKLEYFTFSEERRKKKKKNLNESFEDVLVDQFNKMKLKFAEELENMKKEILKIKNEFKKNLQKSDDESNKLKHLNIVYFSLLNEVKKKLNIE